METIEVEETIVGSLHLNHLNIGNSNNKRNSKQKKTINCTLNDSRNWQHWGHAFWKHLKTSEIPNKNKRKNTKKVFKKNVVAFWKVFTVSQKSSNFPLLSPQYYMMVKQDKKVALLCIWFWCVGTSTILSATTSNLKHKG